MSKKWERIDPTDIVGGVDRVKAVVALVLTLAALALTGCGGQSEGGDLPPKGDGLSQETPFTPGRNGLGEVNFLWVRTPRGLVYCLANRVGYAGGLSCDWANVKGGAQ